MISGRYCSSGIHALGTWSKPGRRSIPVSRFLTPWAAVRRCRNVSLWLPLGRIVRRSETLHDKVTSRPESESAEVAIVGGSAAGLFTASLLARQGRPVRVFERAEKIDPASRTLIVTNRLRRLLGPVAERSIVNEIKRFELFTDGRAATVPLEEPDLIIERSELIHGLAKEAQDHGARIEMGRRFASLKSKDSGVELTFERAGSAAPERVTAESVVGADGAYSSVAKAAGWPAQPTVPLVQALVELPKGMPTDSVRVWFRPDDTPYFYWLIPDSATRGALGLIGIDGHETRRCLDRFMEEKHFRPLGYQGARIPAYTRWTPVERKIGRGRVFLVGDAAGHGKVSTVGGIVTGFRGALGVSQAILQNGSSSELRSLRLELNAHLLIRRSLHRFQQDDYSRLVDSIGGTMLQSLGKVSRDEAARVLWHVCRSRPQLLLTGLRGLLTRTPLASPEE
jgi:flavin-dependent dehydrogenase